MTDVIKYEKQAVVESFDGKLYFTSASNYQALKTALNTDKFVELNGELLNVSSVKKVYISDGEASLSQDQKEALESRKKEFKLNLGRMPNSSEVQTIICKLLKQQNPLA